LVGRGLDFLFTVSGRT